MTKRPTIGVATPTGRKLAIPSETARWERRLRDLFAITDLRDELRNTFAAMALSSGVPLEHVPNIGS
jgi:hypothetical protein